MRRTVRKAFTLVEILIVVVILGILAAIVIPQFTNASQDAQRGNITTQLQSIRNQIELFRVKNSGKLPVMNYSGKDFGDLLAGNNNTNSIPSNTNSYGNIQDPYMRTPPVNPRNQKSDIQVVTGNTDPSATAAAAAASSTTAGWVYNSDTGAFAAFGFNETTGKWVDEQ